MDLSVGIDVGTTKVAVVVSRCHDGKIMFSKSINHEAGYPNENGLSEQDVSKFFDALICLFSSIPIDIKAHIRSLGVSGQMHGVMLWNSENDYTKLINWQDQRASRKNILSSIQQKPGCSGLKDGFGFTTLAILKDEVDLSSFKYSGTIQDFFVWSFLRNKENSFMDPTNAASWGLFNISTLQWDFDAIESLGIPLSIVPKIKRSGSIISSICQEWSNRMEIKRGIPVFLAMGDNQASVFGSATSIDEEIFINIGTSAQLSFISEVLLQNEGKHYEIRPFFDEKYLIVSAPLCGGEAWKLLVTSARQWITTFIPTIDISDEEIYRIIDQKGAESIDKDDLPLVSPHFLGERWDETLKGSIHGITLHNFDLGRISAAFAIGIAKNLISDIETQHMINKSRIIAAGNAIRKSTTLQKAVTKVFHKEVVINDDKEEAAFGASRVAYLFLKK